MDVTERTHGSLRPAPVPMAALLVAVIGVAAGALILGGAPAAAPSTPAGGQLSNPPAAVSSAANAAAAEAAASAAAEAAPSATCQVTRPDPRFKPPKDFVQSLPGYYGSEWFGTAHLWTMVAHDGEIWHGLPRSDAGFGQKTFWWSADWTPRIEEQPAITVTGRRLDGPGSFTAGNPGTNATADFGTAMLVGVEVPSAGCWELTASYRAASLSIVVLVTG
jgi:hypothetical protein